jgi:hypothetical protein
VPGRKKIGSKKKRKAAALDSSGDKGASGSKKKKVQPAPEADFDIVISSDDDIV